MVFCEGEVTEPMYLHALRASVRATTNVDIQLGKSPSGAVPATLLTRAIAAQQKAKVEGDDIDEFWCVFDVEWPRNHPRLVETLARAQRSGIKTAVSNPCFELWLVLHHRDHSKFVNNDEARRLRRKCDGADGKALDAPSYMASRRDAARRARELDRHHEHDDVAFPHNNPSSGMHLLLASIDGDGVGDG
jgi:RloB-like protein